MEDFLSISFLSRTCVRGAKAGLSSRTPKVHPDDELCVWFRTNIRNMKWRSFHFSFFSHIIEKKKKAKLRMRSLCCALP